MSRLLPLVAVLLAIACRAWLHFTTALVPGMNGGYYLVQARSLIEKGSLGIPDLPLVFTVHAGLACVIKALSSLDLDHSVMLAVRLGDSILPALAVLPVMLLGMAWSSGSKIDLAISALTGVAITAGPAALSMVGEFEKNSLGLALMCGFALAMHQWGQHPGRRTMLTAAGLLGLIGLTHIGVFGTSLVFAASTFAILAMTQGREGFKRVARFLMLALPIVIAAGAVVFWRFDPSRIHKLLHAFSEPVDYLGGGMQGPGGMGPGGKSYVIGVAYGLVVLLATVIAWFRKNDDNRATVAVVTGAAITVVAIVGPWVQGDKVMRFTLNATPLTLLCLLYLVLSIPRRMLRASTGFVLLAALMAMIAPQLQGGGRPIITEEAHAELQTLTKVIKDPTHTLVVARHGLEWWTAWTLHTHIAQAQAVTSNDWKAFTQVLFIDQKKGMGMPSMMGFGGPPPGMGGRGFQGRPGFSGEVEPPPGMRPPFMGTGPRGPGPMGGGMMGAKIPDDAEILHSGECFTLGWVKTPPSFVLERERSPFDPFGEWDALTR